MKIKINKEGFSLVEFIIVIVIIGAIAGMAAPFISTILNAWVFSKTERDIIFSARLSLNRMAREIRQIRNVASINTFTSTEFDFIHIDDNQIDFKQSGSLLLRNANELSDKLQNPGGLEFTYLDSDGNVTGVRDNIRMVRIKLILVSGSNNLTVESLARFRNTS